MRGREPRLLILLYADSNELLEWLPLKIMELDAQQQNGAAWIPI